MHQHLTTVKGFDSFKELQLDLQADFMSYIVLLVTQALYATVHIPTF